MRAKRLNFSRNRRYFKGAKFAIGGGAFLKPRHAVYPPENKCARIGH